MELTIIGCSPADPNPDTASSGYLLDSGKGQLLLECGHGVVGKLQLYTQFDQLKAALISHMHPDHFFDLVALKYALTRARLPALPLYLPPGGNETLMGIASALHEDADFWTSTYDIHTFDPERGLEINGFRIRMAPTHHFIPAWAMTFEPVEDGRRRFAYSSDTSLSDTIVELARGASLLMAEASIKKQPVPAAKRGHLTPSEAGELAHSAGAGGLVITHYPAGDADRILADARKTFGRDVVLATEGAHFTI